MTDETTTEQLAEIEGQATEYTPPEGWRVLAVGERLQDGDMWVWPTADQLRQTVHVGAVVGANQRYIRPIEPQPEPVPAVQGGLVRDVTHLLEESGVLDSAKAEQQIEELRSEVSYVQNLLGTERRRVTQLEKLVGSLRTINEAQEKSFNAANKANDDLQHRLNVVAAEWAEQAETSRRLQIELDAAQQVPAAIADRFEEGWNQGTARAIETVLEWLQPIRAVDHLNLSNEILQHLPQIMRHLTGLAQD